MAMPLIVRERVVRERAGTVSEPPNRFESTGPVAGDAGAARMDIPTMRHRDRRETRPRRASGEWRHGPCAGPWRWILACLLLPFLSVAQVAGRPAAADEIRQPPRRVVSMNLCTDQLAMLIAAPGQLHSVSVLATQAQSSAMAQEARQYAVNHGRAEEIFLMKPDLVLAGSFSTRATVAMLRRLGIRVEEFAPETSFADIGANVRRMGELLGQEGKAEALLQGFTARLARYPQQPEEHPLAALYYANSYTSGASTMAGETVERAGLRNLGRELGLSGTAKLPLETLVMNAPDAVVSGNPEGAPGLAYENLAHPALRAVLRGRGFVNVPDKYTLCGTPFTAEAVRILAEARASVSR
jgi:iron complex transport system substrate-binding protein